MAPKSMSSEVENIELKGKEKITRTNKFVRVSILTFLRSYTTLMQLSTVTRQEVE